MVEKIQGDYVVPDHVPAHLVVDFDWYDFGTRFEDASPQWLSLRERAPQGIFWSPRNGGHWVPLRSEDIAAVIADHDRFSSSNINIPRDTAKTTRLLPNELDPPAQLPYRSAIMPMLTPAKMALLEDEVRAKMVGLIDGLVGRGRCEFVAEFASILPVSVFFDIMALPVDDREMLLEISNRITRTPDNDVRAQAFVEIGDYLRPWLVERREHPGEDLLSVIANAKVKGEPISDGDALMLAINVLLGGLDTVANILSSIALFLARNPGHRRQLIERPELIKNATEELMRRFGVISNGRLVVQDTELCDTKIRAGDMILASTILYGVDDAHTQDPLTVDFERERPEHIVFGKGAHVCPGQHLARREVRIFLDEWLRAIPDFEVEPGSDPYIISSNVSGLTSLHLRWPSRPV